MHANDNMPVPPALMSIKEACALTSLSRTAINNLRRAGAYPGAVDLGERRIAFVRSEVDEWIHERISARQAA